MLTGRSRRSPAPSSPRRRRRPNLPGELKAQQAAGADRRIYDAGAVATNIFLVPGRAITCLLGGVAGIVVLAATFGTAYRAASGAVHEGCGGKWMVTGDDLRPECPYPAPGDWE